MSHEPESVSEDQIKACDRELAALLEKRLVLMQVKSERTAAELVASLVQSIERECHKDLPEEVGATQDSPLIKVAMIGGAGGMGRFMTRILSEHGCVVQVVELADYSRDIEGKEVALEQSRAVMWLSQADWCIVTVPIDVTQQVIEQIAPFLRADCLLSDFTSIKEQPLEWMADHHAGPILGLHPMFGPSTKSFVNQVVVASEVAGRSRSELATRVLLILKQAGAKVVECSGKEHDDAMRVIQALRHFTTVAYGHFLAQIAPEQNGFLARLLELSSPVYRLELMMVGRLFAQDPQLYCDIISASEKNLKLIRAYLDSAGRCLDVLEQRDRERFIADFNQTTEFFGEYATSFLHESSDILESMQSYLQGLGKREIGSD